MSPQHEKRRQYFIKLPFQIKFILQFCFLIVLGSVLFGAAVYFYSSRTLTTAFFYSRLRVMSTADFLLPAILISAFAITGFITMAAAVRLLLVSHRIAGPLYRLERITKEIGKGNLGGPIRLRSQDELQELARSLDEMLLSLKPRIGKIRYETEQLKGVVARIENGSLTGKQVLEALKEVQTGLEEQVIYFRG